MNARPIRIGRIPLIGSLQAHLFLERFWTYSLTLTLRLWPLLQQVKTTRVYWQTMLLKFHSMILTMAKNRDIAGAYDRRIAKYVVRPNFYDLVPQDRQILIEEITRRAEQNLISPEEAVARFGVQAGTEQDEVNRIKAWLEFKAEMEAKGQPVERKPAKSAEQVR